MPKARLPQRGVLCYHVKESGTCARKEADQMKKRHFWPVVAVVLVVFTVCLVITVVGPGG